MRNGSRFSPPPQTAPAPQPTTILACRQACPMAVDAGVSSAGAGIPSDGGSEGKEDGVPSDGGLEGTEGAKCGVEEPVLQSGDSSPRKAGPGEFDLLKVIGIGAFGKVLQVR